MDTGNLDSFLVIYSNFAKAENQSVRSTEAVLLAVRQFNKFVGSDRKVDSITGEDLRRYIRLLQQQEKWSTHPHIAVKHVRLSPHSVASYVRSIRSFWSWLLREGFIQENPFERVKPPKTPRKVIAPLTPEQIASLIKAIPRKNHTGERDRAIVIVLYGTGLRISELLNLKVSDVNFDNGQVNVMGKGSRERVVFMSAGVYKPVLKYLTQWRPPSTSEFFFLGEKGRPLDRFFVAHSLHDYGKRAGITGVRCSPHTLRYSFAIEYLRSPGADTFSLQRILGHATQEMTMHYAQFADRDIEAKQKAFSPVERLPKGI